MKNFFAIALSISLIVLSYHPLYAKNNRISIVRGPYLQNSTSDSITVVWKSSGKSIGSIEYGLNGKLDTIEVDNKKKKTHAITLEGLMPNRTYKYRIKGKGLYLSKKIDFILIMMNQILFLSLQFLEMLAQGALLKGK